MLCQFQYELTPRQAPPGRNIPSDLHKEHLNRITKDAIRGLSTNKAEKAVQKGGKTLGMFSPFLDNFDSINNVKQPSGSHKAPGFAKDQEIIVKHLQRYDIFSYHKDRTHRTFPNPRNTLHTLDIEVLSLTGWLNTFNNTIIIHVISILSIV